MTAFLASNYADGNRQVINDRYDWAVFHLVDLDCEGNASIERAVTYNAASWPNTTYHLEAGVLMTRERA